MAMCRACGDYPVDQNRLRENLQKYSDIYFNLTSITLTPDEDPDRQRICDDCHLKLLEYNRFRSVCLQVHFRLTEIKTEIDIDYSDLVTIAPLKVETLEPLEDDLKEVGSIKDDILSNDEDDGNKAEDDDDYEADDNELTDEESDQLLSELDNASDEHFKKPKQHKKKKGDGPKEERLGCNLCDKTFRTDKRLQSHLRNHQGLKAFVCNVCSKQLKSFSSLTVHMKAKHSDAKKEFVCDFPECGSSYSAKHALKTHRKRHDPNYIEPERKRVVCDQCGKTYHNASALKEHSFVHSGEKPFQCQVCNKAFPTVHRLKDHTNRHEGVRNHICPYCGMKKTTRQELKVHMNTHTKERQFTCHVCAKVFYKLCNMNKHIKVVHQGIKAYNCSYCDSSFGKAASLKYHEMTHTGEKPHECKVCGKRCIQASNLKLHMKTHRKYELEQEAQRSTATSHLHQKKQSPDLDHQQSVSLLQAAAVATVPMMTSQQTLNAE